MSFLFTKIRKKFARCCYHWINSPNSWSIFCTEWNWNMMKQMISCSFKFCFSGLGMSQMFQMVNSSTSGWTPFSLISRGPVTWHTTQPFLLHPSLCPWQEDHFQPRLQVVLLDFLTHLSIMTSEWAGRNTTVVAQWVLILPFPLQECSDPRLVQEILGVWSLLLNQVLTTR